VPTNYRPSTDEVKRVWDRIKNLKKKGKLPEPTEEDLIDEPTALAFTPYDTYEDETLVPLIDEIPDEELFEENVYYVEKTDEPNKVKRLRYTKKND